MYVHLLRDVQHTEPVRQLKICGGGGGELLGRIWFKFHAHLSARAGTPVTNTKRKQHVVQLSYCCAKKLLLLRHVDHCSLLPSQHVLRTRDLRHALTSESQSPRDGHRLLERLVQRPVRVGGGGGLHAVVGSLKYRTWACKQPKTKVHQRRDVYGLVCSLGHLTT